MTRVAALEGHRPKPGRDNSPVEGKVHRHARLIIGLGERGCDAACDRHGDAVRRRRVRLVGSVHQLAIDAAALAMFTLAKRCSRRLLLDCVAQGCVETSQKWVSNVPMTEAPEQRCHFYRDLETSGDQNEAEKSSSWLPQSCERRALRAGCWMRLVRQPRHPITLFPSQQWLSQQQIRPESLTASARLQTPYVQP